MQNGKSAPDLPFSSPLVVEPTAHIRHLAVGLLKNTVMKDVNMCSTPFEALKIIAAKKSDIILSGSTHGTASALALMIRQGVDSPKRNIPIIMLAGGMDHSSILAARDNGIDSVLAVPFSANTLAGRFMSLSRSQPDFLETQTFIGPDRRRQSRPVPHEDRRTGRPPSPAAPNKNCRELLKAFIESQKRAKATNNTAPPTNGADGVAVPPPPEYLGLQCTVRELRPEMKLLHPCNTKGGLTIVRPGVPLTRQTILRLIDVVGSGEIDDLFQVET